MIYFTSTLYFVELLQLNIKGRIIKQKHIKLLNKKHFNKRTLNPDLYNFISVLSYRATTILNKGQTQVKAKNITCEMTCYIL